MWFTQDYDKSISQSSNIPDLLVYGVLIHSRYAMFEFVRNTKTIQRIYSCFNVIDSRIFFMDLLGDSVFGK